jgi:SAM-dependent methyltransferase
MTTEFKVNDSCRLCCSNHIKKVVDLPLTVPGEQLKSKIDDKDPKLIPIDLWQCGECGHVQLVHVPPQSSLWGSDYTFMPSDNPKLIEHFGKSVDYFVQNFKNDIDFAFEIGSNDGLFLGLLNRITGCRVLGIDPSIGPVNIARKNKVETILNYFSSEQAEKIIHKYGKPDLVIANNVFAHMDNLRNILSSIEFMLKDNGYFMFEFSNLKDVVEKYLIGTILHEHLSVHSVYSIVQFLNEFGLQLIGVRHVSDVQGGAIVGVAKKGLNKELPPEINKIIENEKNSGITSFAGMKLFNKNLKSEIQKLREDINNINHNSQIIGYGAARTAPLIIDLLGLRNKIKYIIDDNPNKIGKYLSIGNIPIIGSDEHEITTEKTTYIILGWAQTERIINKLKSIDKHFSAITICPYFEIYNFKNINN